MSLKKLTLSVDEIVIDRARKYSEVHNTSISRLVSEFLAGLPQESPELAPAVERIAGILPSHVEEVEYRRHLEEKYGG